MFSGGGNAVERAVVGPTGVVRRPVAGPPDTVGTPGAGTAEGSRGTDGGRSAVVATPVGCGPRTLGACAPSVEDMATSPSSATAALFSTDRPE